MKLSKFLILSFSSVIAAASLSGCVVDNSGAPDSSYNTHSRDVYYKKGGRVKVVNKTNCDGFGCSTTTKKVRHKASGKTVVKKQTCDDFGNCYTTKHHHW